MTCPLSLHPKLDIAFIHGGGCKCGPSEAWYKTWPHVCNPWRKVDYADKCNHSDEEIIENEKKLKVIREWQEKEYGRTFI
jgi:hypothetical protein